MFFEPLECRKMMAISIPNIPNIAGTLAALSASVVTSGDELRITGTESADKITVESHFRIRIPPLGGGVRQVIDQLRVKITDLSGNVRKNADGQPLDLFINRAGINIMYITARGGADTIDTRTSSLDSVIYLGKGNDVANTGSRSDNVYGELGNDSATLGGGIDYFGGGEGNDTGYGGAGNDVLAGEAGQDKLFGEAGADALDGGSGDDFLSGGSGIDQLQGGSGRDALLGGPSNDRDVTRGGSGQDRFLEWSSSQSGTFESRPDFSPSVDAVIFFRDAAEQDVNLGSNVGETRYSAGTWAESEIEASDVAFLRLQDKTANTMLLRTSNGGSLTFFRAGSPTTNVEAADGIGGWNDSAGAVTLTDVTMSGTSQDIQGVVIHEIAHNWDKEGAGWQDWLALSGWEVNNGGSAPAGKVLSDDGNWWRNENAEFSRGYGQMNPMEDFATMWEAYFGYDGTSVASKAAHLDGFFSYIFAVGHA
jgi:Ca2+-binding RTX toxin-like protein